MEVKNIILFVIIIVLLLIVIRYIMQDVNTLSGLIPAQTMITIQPSNLASSANYGNTSNYTYSIWFFVEDWNYRYGEPKVIFGRMTTGTGQKEPCPSVTLGPIQNNIIVSLAVYPGIDEVPENGTNYIVHSCGISNVPIQRWCNFFMSVYGRTLDLYLDGKLVQTKPLAGTAEVDPDASVYITPAGGFSGWTSKFAYYPNALNPQEVWDIYSAGYGASWLSNLFGKYSVKISFLENGTEDSSFTF